MSDDKLRNDIYIRSREEKCDLMCVAIYVCGNQGGEGVVLFQGVTGDRLAG